MVPAKSKIKSAKQLKGATVCVQSGTTTEKNLTDFSRANKLDIKPVVFEKLEAANGAFFAGRCQAYTTDASGLASMRNKEAKNPDDHVILPELISKEPLGPAVRRGDDEFFAIAKWVVFALIEAEEYGITQANVDAACRATAQDPAIERLLGSAEDTGKLLGLDKDWADRAIKAIGNYGEIFERNVGPKTRAGAAARREQPLEQGRPACTRRRCAESSDRLRRRARDAAGTAACRRSDAQRHDGTAAPKQRDWSLAQPAVRGLVYQVLGGRLIVLALWCLAHNTLENMRLRGIQSGFGFLLRAAPASTSAKR